MARKTDAPEKTDWRRQAREVADSLAIAFILAMVIRHFVLEVFKIPTKSMQPTLLGDPVYGDKILVNKFAYDFKEPKRWDIIVFKYPEDTSKNYIKRLVGLPGETVKVRDGDVFIDGGIARKPWPVQQALWRRREDSEKAERWRPDSPSLWQCEDGRLEVDCGASRETEFCRYGPDIFAYDPRDFQVSRKPFYGIYTSDIMVQFLLEPQRVGGSVHVSFRMAAVTGSLNHHIVDEWEVEVPVSEAEATPRLYRGDAEVGSRQPYRVAVGASTLVQVCNVDRAVSVRVGGDEVARCEYEPSAASSQWPSGEHKVSVRIGCREGHVVFRQQALFTDVHYTNDPRFYAVDEPYKLSRDGFFVLGDNSINSNDSRKWAAVPRENLVGEAFLVLWPLGRMKLVR
jgi:signal peptidase I